jgi:polyhydroxyalkanoate synthesis regulator protein
LRQLIRFYGDSMQMLVPRYLEVSLDSLTRDQAKFRDQITQAFGMGGLGGLGAMEEQARRNMELFERTFAMFSPFSRQTGGDAAGSDKPAGETPTPRSGGDDINELKRQMTEMQHRLDRLGDKE